MSHNIFKEYPDKEELLEWYSLNGSNIIHNVNNHFHTPYSFSAFSDIKQIFETAKKEDVKILGINDFYTTDGFEEFNELSTKYKIFPFFNIEFIGLLKEKQKEGIRVNDPNNPGRTYFSGKGLDFPVRLYGNSFIMLEKLRKESGLQTKKMLKLVSDHLEKIHPELKLDYNNVMEKYTHGMLRERHISRAVREIVFSIFKSDQERKETLKKIYGGIDSKVELSNPPDLEGEIRSRLLKSGGIAFVKEDSEAFPEIEQIIKIITDAGGIPTYPVLLDDANGNYTEFERDMEDLYNELTEMNIFSLELIPIRNDFEHLKEFVSFFHYRNFIISFGTEHNTPELIPLKIMTRGNRALDEYLKRVNFESVCVTAAHQYFRSKGFEGYTDKNGKARIQHKDEFIELGNAVIEYFLQN